MAGERIGVWGQRARARACLRSPLTEPQFTCWVGSCSSRGPTVGRCGQHCFPPWVQPRAAPEWRPPSALAPALPRPGVHGVLPQQPEQASEGFHSSHFIPQRGPRELEQLPKGCTVGTCPDQPGLGSFLTEDPGLQPGPSGSRAHCAWLPGLQCSPEAMAPAGWLATLTWGSSVGLLECP